MSNIDLQGTFHIKENGNDYALIPEFATNEKEGIVKLATNINPPIAATPDSVIAQINSQVFNNQTKIPWSKIDTGEGTPVIRGEDPETHGQLLTINNDNELFYSDDITVGDTSNPIYLDNGQFLQGYPVTNVQQTPVDNNSSTNQPILLKPADSGNNAATEYATGLAFQPQSQQLIVPKLVNATDIGNARLYETWFEKRGEPSMPPGPNDEPYPYWPQNDDYGNPRQGRGLTNTIEDYVVEEFIPAVYTPDNTLLGDYRHVPLNYMNEHRGDIIIGPYDYWAYRIWRNGRLEIWRWSYLTNDPALEVGWTNYGDANGDGGTGSYWETKDHSWSNTHAGRADSLRNVKIPYGITFLQEPSWQVNLRYVWNQNGDTPDYASNMSQVGGFKWNVPRDIEHGYFSVPMLRAYTFAIPSPTTAAGLNNSLRVIFFELYASGFYDTSILTDINQ